MTEESLLNIDDTSKSIKSEETFQLIGERNAVVFSADTGDPPPPLELTDDFFDLDKDDMKVLLKDLKHSREDMENRPFRTKAVREMEESSATLSRLNRYTHTVVRVQFPDRIVLQAVFSHSETVQHVIDFVRTFIQPPDVQFYLYTAPPKWILDPSVTLVDAKLTPRALVYFGTVSPHEQTTFLQPSLLSSLSCVRLASQAALQYRREIIEEVVKEDTVVVPNEEPINSYQNPNKPSTSKKSSTNSKVPKWFKK